MGFCSYSKEFSLSAYTSVENQFINKYMAMAEGDAVKVYLFGLYLCQNVQQEYSLTEAAKSLGLEEKRVIDLFQFWEDFDLLEIVSYQPFSVRYFPADYSKGKPKRIRTEKYSEFNKALQSLMPKRMISSNEYTKYFAVMEEYAIKPEAMLLIVRYCIDLKGENIALNYILQVAKNFAAEGITSVEQIETKLSDYVLQSGDLAAVLRAMGSQRKPEPDDYKLFRVWTEELGFEPATVQYAASLLKKGGMQKLDETMRELYSNKKFSAEEIKEYFDQKENLRQLTLSIAKELGVYCAVPETYIDHFVSGWLAIGYSFSSLIQLAKYCFRRGKKSFEKMDELIKKLASAGVVSAESIVIYMENEAREQEFAAEMLKAAGLTRRVNNWDRECLRNWRAWGFTDDMILKAASFAQSKASPIPYINSVLSSWKSKNIFSLDMLAKEETVRPDHRREQAEKDEDFKKKVRSYYFNLREKAQDRADHYRKIAEADKAFLANEEAIKTTEIRLAKEEALGGNEIKQLSNSLQSLRIERAEILKRLHLREDMLVPQYRCKKCKDTGFDENGNVCECYKKFVENVNEDKKLENILDAYSNIEL